VIEETRDLGSGVALSVHRQRGRPAGSRGSLSRARSATQRRAPCLTRPGQEGRRPAARARSPRRPWAMPLTARGPSPGSASSRGRP